MDSAGLAGRTVIVTGGPPASVVQLRPAQPVQAPKSSSTRSCLPKTQVFAEKQEGLDAPGRNSMAILAVQGQEKRQK